jgi:hypothetical protein
MSVDRQFVAPPFPAAYLRGLPPLPDALLAASDGRRQLSPATDLELLLEMRIRKREIRERRAGYEERYNIVIVPERPYAP